jgi:hypothetical protein
MAVAPDSGDCLITFADLPAQLTNKYEKGGIITNSLGPFPQQCGLSFHSEHLRMFSLSRSPGALCNMRQLVLHSV